MKAFTKPLFDLAGFDEMTKTAENNKGLISVTGCIDAQKPQMIYAFGGDKKNKLIVTFHEQKAKELYEEYSFFDREVVYYPAKDMLFYQSDIRGNLLTAERIKALKAIRENEHVTLVTTFDALMNTMAPLESMWDSVLSLESGQTADMEELTAALVRMGYEKEYQVETIGQFSVRGGILDIFPLTEENPIRIEFWGDEIDTIRYFDCESQKSIESVDEISIYPASEIVLTDEKKSEGIQKMLDEAERVSEKLRKDMKTEEAYRVSSTAKELAEEWGELSMYAGMDAFL
ncbi:MAG: transcription-repair coupling factor, partial [Agathobacter sp.]|nr:transcription-repair coupling factor [Agathobacter sp.]